MNDYVGSLGKGAGSLRIGVVKEGFGRPESGGGCGLQGPGRGGKIRSLGATVDEVSIPGPSSGLAIWTPIALEGLTSQMMLGNGMGTGWKGLYTTSLLDFHAHWRSRADELSDTLKICMFMGQYYLKHHRGHYSPRRRISPVSSARNTTRCSPRTIFC